MDIAAGFGRVGPPDNGLQVVNDNPSPAAQWLVSTLAELAGKTKLPNPKEGIYGSPEWKAFATGPSPELEAVLAHEMGHLGIGDMVTMTLLQGVINSLVMLLARASALALPRDQRDDGRDYGQPPAMLLIWPLEVLLRVLGSPAPGLESDRQHRVDRRHRSGSAAGVASGRPGLPRRPAAAFPLGATGAAHTFSPHASPS